MIQRRGFLASCLAAVLNPLAFLRKNPADSHLAAQCQCGTKERPWIKLELETGLTVEAEPGLWSDRLNVEGLVRTEWWGIIGPSNKNWMKGEIKFRHDPCIYSIRVGTPPDDAPGFVAIPEQTTCMSSAVFAVT
jgi:hypothetical protein